VFVIPHPGGQGSAGSASILCYVPGSATRTRRRAAAWLVVAAGVAALLAAPATARLSVIYDSADVVGSLIQTQPDGSPGLDPSVGLLQQQPAPQVLPASQQVWKVTSREGSDATPSVAGLDASHMAAVLTDRIKRSGGHMVFLDELDGDFTGPDGAALDGALTILAGRPNPYSPGEPGGLARRVHVYVPGVGVMLANPAAWASAWHALTLAGGVWLETYSGTSQWTPEQWLAWPGAFARRLASLGGDVTRIHLVLFGGDGDATWDQALVGDACTLLANGPGAYRLEGDGPTFVARFRAVFGTGPAPAGPSPIACTPAPVLQPSTAQALASALALPGQGFALGHGQLSTSRLTVGVPQRLTVSLGADPLGLAARFGADPRAFWGAARARVTATAPGLTASAGVSSTGTASLTLTPTATGPIPLALVMSGAPIHAALGAPADLFASLAPLALQIGPTLDSVLASPNGWTLTIPLGYAAAPAGPVLAAGPPRPPPPPRAARLVAGLAGPSAPRRGLDPRRLRLALLRALDAQGRGVPRAHLVVRLPNGRGQRRVANAAGRLVVRLPARGGRLRAAVAGTQAKVSLEIPTTRVKVPARR